MLLETLREIDDSAHYPVLSLPLISARTYDDDINTLQLRILVADRYPVAFLHAEDRGSIETTGQGVTQGPLGARGAGHTSY